MDVDATALSFVLDATGNRLTVPSAEIRTRTGRISSKASPTSPKTKT